MRPQPLKDTQVRQDHCQAWDVMTAASLQITELTSLANVKLIEADSLSADFYQNPTTPALYHAAAISTSMMCLWLDLCIICVVTAPSHACCDCGFCVHDVFVQWAACQW